MIGFKNNTLNEETLRNKLDKYIILELNAVTVNDKKAFLPLIKYHYDLN